MAAQKAVSINWGNIAVALRPMGERALEIFQSIITAGLGDENLVQHCRKLRTSIVINAVRRHPQSTLKQRFSFEFSKCYRFLSPSGVLIAVLGVDGAGKSTIIRSIQPLLDSATHNANFIKHLRPGLLPPLARLKGKTKVQVGPVLKPHDSIPSGFIGSLFRLSYLTLDYILGYWFLIRPKIAKQPAVVIF